MRGFSTCASQAAVEIVTLPNGEPPVGGSKIPLTTNVSVAPFGNVQLDRRADVEVVVVGVAVVDEHAVLAELGEDVLRAVLPVEPMTCAVPGSTAVAKIVSSKTRASPVRTLPITSTPGALAAASAASIGIGEKLFCAVIA